MSVDQLSPRSHHHRADDAKLVAYDEYIDTHIQNTRRAVKAVDWATSLVTLAACVIAFLLTVAIVEHWLVPSGLPVAARAILFAVLVGGVGWFAYHRLWPLCRRAINPVYAAQTIERSSPSLKNSLINLLLFRQHRAEIADAVYHTLEEQAAQRLTRVPMEAAVDRSLLIRVGYVLLGVVAIAALYKVVSPKDPLIAARRVLVPWSDIVPASRVSIGAVTPGSLTVARGEFVDVSAQIRNITENDAVLLRYTTDDGQAIDKPIEMLRSSDGLRFEARLPDDDGGANKLGLAQNVTYHIEAGDAHSLDYAVTVVPAPSILVERIDYDYPDYTGYPNRQVDGVGDIQALEGTRVTIHTRANGEIRQSHLDFDADGRRDLEMTARGTNAQAAFVLALREDRQTPQHASYVLRFTDADGRQNREPVKYAIAVEPDRSPEAAILRPEEKVLDVRLDKSVAIEVEARDPDFALAEVRLRGEVAGRPVIDELLLKRTHSGRFTARFQFVPAKLELRPGDVVDYWVIANDNRAPDANSVESQRQRLRIASPNAGQQPPPDRLAQRENQNRQPQNGKQQPQPEPGQGQPQDAGGEQAPRDERAQSKQNEQPGEQRSERDGEPSDQQPPDGKSFSREAQPSAQQQRDQSQQKQPRGGESAKPDQTSENRSRDSASQQDGEGQPGDQTQSGKEPNSHNQQSNGEQTGAGAAGGESSQKGSQPAGTRPEHNTTPVSPDGDNDAEAFERIQKHMERKGELTAGEPQPQNESTANGDAQSSPTNSQSSREAKPTTERASSDNRPAEQPDTPSSGNKQNSDRAGENEKPPKDESAQQTRNQEQQPGQLGATSAEKDQGAGAETRNDDLPQKQQQPQENVEPNESPGGQQTASKGPSGAGDEQQSQGAPNSQPEMKPGEKPEQTGSAGEQADKEEPAAGARGKRESDSRGEEGGDRARGGEEGGGQKAPREGTGSAGQNQSADEGAGESAEKGAGNDSPNAGRDKASDDPTGQTSGETPGRGSKQRRSEGEQPAGEIGNEQQQGAGVRPSQRDGARDAARSESPQMSDKKPNSREAQPSDPGNSDSRSQNTTENSPQSGAPTGDGGPNATNDRPPSRTESDAPDADAANLEYARKQTDLVLERLSDQINRKRVDKSLLEQLGWTEDDLQRFVDRWQRLKETAEGNNAAGESTRRGLDEALRSLGLRPGGPARQSRVNDDTQRDFRQGFRGPVPPKYHDRLRAYNQGVSRARQADGER